MRVSIIISLYTAYKFIELNNIYSDLFELLEFSKKTKRYEYLAYLQQLTFLTSICNSKKAIVIKNVRQLKDLEPIIHLETYDMVLEMEYYRGKISKDIDKVIEYQIHRNMTSILK